MKNIPSITTRSVLTFLLGLALTACVSVFFVPTGNAEGVDPLTEADQAAFRRGRTLSVTECMNCHRVFRPTEYSPEEWPGIVRKMGGRASLSESQIKDLEVYFVAAAKIARSPRKE